MKKDFWNGKVVLITGASSGIGHSIFLELSKLPCTLILVARRAEEIPNPTGLHPESRVIRINCDLSQESEISKLKEKVQKSVNQIDILFNNAGITAHGRFDSLSMEVYHRTFAINFFGPVFLIQSLLPLLLKAKGNVVTTSTVSALYGVPGRAAYSSSKSALHAALEALRIEMMEEGIGISLVCVPYTDTALRQSGLASDGSKLEESPAKGKRLKSEEVAKRLLSIAEDKEARLVTINSSGRFLNWLRLFLPKFLEKTMYKKLKHDFQKH
ncbi:MAG: SDR family NAD(P)-dependent oxidoreductase [Leptospira sp.]|nr:SDR family NAD(P)-dependent oxidoreductase [Leptospira sp.]